MRIVKLRIASAAMRHLLVYTSTVLVMVMGCGHASKNTLHVTSVTPDAAVDVAGTLNGKDYELRVDRTDVPLYIAYYEPINVQDVGKDFPAQLEKTSGELVVQVPNKGAVHYSIRSVHEKN
jgi:hypothetical protein